MKMGDVERSHLGGQSTPHGPRPIETSQHPTGEVGDAYAFHVDRHAERHGALTGSIDIGGEDVDFVTSPSQAAR
jgi:hypothetical protein